jgi:hypothetical protein
MIGYQYGMLHEETRLSLYRTLSGVALLLSTCIPLSSAADRDPVITLERGRCAGCLEYDLRVFEDGRIEYFGKRNVDVIGVKITQIDRKQIQEIVLEFQHLGFFDLSDVRNADTDTIFADFDCTEWMDPLLAGLKTADDCRQGKPIRAGIRLSHRDQTGDRITLREGLQQKTLVVDNVNLGEAQELMQVVDRLIRLIPVRTWTGEEHGRRPLNLWRQLETEGQPGNLER